MKNKQSTHPKMLGSIYKWLRISLFVYIVSEILVGVGSLLIYNTGSYIYGRNHDVTLGDGVVSFGSTIFLFAFFASVILFSRYSYRAVKNILYFEPDSMDVSPGWSVGWYFVPVANLWKPYGVMNEIWMGSRYAGEQFEGIPKSVPIWWFFWVASNIVSNISLRMSLRSGGLIDEFVYDIPLYRTSLLLDSISSFTGIIAALMLIRILAPITANQDLRIQTEI